MLDSKQGIELWETTVNSFFRRNTISTGGRAIWLSSDGPTGAHNGNTFENNLCYGTNIGVDIDVGNANVFTNNTFVSGIGASVLNIDSGTGTVFKNNICYQRDAGAGGNPMVRIASGSEVSADIDNNLYYTEAVTKKWILLPNATDTSFAAWQSTATPIDANSAYGDPLFTDIDNDDYTLSNSSPAKYETAVEATGPSGDINNNARYGGIDLGAIQYQRHPTITTGINLV